MGVSDSILGGLFGVVTNDASAMVGDLAGGAPALQTILAELKASEAAALAESPAASATLRTNGVPTSDPYNDPMNKFFTDPNFKYSSTMDDWKAVAKYAEDYVSDWYAKNPNWNNSFGGDSLFNMPPSASFLVGYQNGVPVYANAARGAPTIGGYYSVDSSGKLTYGEGKKGKGSPWWKKALPFIPLMIGGAAVAAGAGAGAGLAGSAATGTAATTAGTTVGATAAETAATGSLLDLVATPELGSLVSTVGGVTVGDVTNAALLAGAAGTLLAGTGGGSPDKLSASTTGIEEYEEEIDSAASAAAERERAAARLKKGRSSTIVGGKRMSEPAILARPTILGG